MTRKRILIPHRIIPKELYVQRDADRQLKSILEDMASPGYVLVARQMGKTNMLLNAKRSYQTANDVFTYVDLSNAFNSETECFRQIIDKSIDTHQELLNVLKPIIKEIRHEQLPPHLEHLQELRTILNHIKGKMVIILDEIDALTRSVFSDKIFAQIRSIYFERESYNELTRLTYVISGVVEPTEIIKNPKISPFNIGEKIFLDDFSRKEHEEFLTKAKLDFDTAISERIFFWTSGNPRMTYDICSEAEIQMGQSELSPTVVDAIIKKLYLTNFDKAPVDHIRELVASDKAIRNALLVMRYGNGSKIEDHIKTKLYLAGIIGPDFNSEQLDIKNRIIEQSLSEAWIQNLERQIEKPRDIIKKLVESRHYKRVTDYYISLTEDELDQLGDADRYNIGLAYFKQAEFMKAVEMFNMVKYDKNYQLQQYLDNLLYLGESYEKSANYEKAIGIFETVAKTDLQGKYFMLGTLNLGQIYIDFENGRFRDKSRSLLETILSSSPVHADEVDLEFHENLMVAAKLYYGKLLNRIAEYGKAMESLDAALDLADVDAKPAIMLAKLNFSREPQNSRLILNEIVNLIIEFRLKPAVVINIDICFSQEVLYDIVNNLLIHLPTRFDELCLYLIDEFAKLRSEDFLLQYYDLGFLAVAKQNFKLAKHLLEMLLLDKRFTQVNETVLFNSFRIVLSSDIAIKETELIMSRFYEFLSTHRKFVLNALEFDILFKYAERQIEKQDFTRSNAVLSFLSGSLEKAPEELQSSRYRIEFMEITTLNLASFTDAARDRSRLLLQNMDKLSSQEIQKNPILASSMENMINSLSIISLVNPGMAGLRHTPKDSDRIRVKYQNGRIVNAKFRKVKNDIASGLCRIL